MVIAAARAVRWPARPVLPRRPARQRRSPRPSGALAARRAGDQAPPAGRGVHARPSRGALARSRSRDERSLPVLIHAGRGIPALGVHAVELAERVPRRAPDPRPRRDHRPVVDLAGRGRPAEPAVRHRLVDAGRPAGAVLAGAARPDRCSPATRPTATRWSRPRSSFGWGCRRGCRPSRSARSPPTSRCGSPPASRSSRRGPADRRARARRACAAGPGRGVPAARHDRVDARRSTALPRCWRSAGSPARCPTRSTTRPCSRRSASLLDQLRRGDRPRTPTTAAGSRS